MSSHRLAPHIRRLLAAEPGSPVAEKEQRAIEQVMMAAVRERGPRAAEALFEAAGIDGFVVERLDSLPFMWRIATEPPRVLELWYTGGDDPLIASLSYRTGKPWGSRRQRAAASLQADFYARYARAGVGERSRLARDDRLVVLIGDFEADVNNGGFSQYLGNKGVATARRVLGHLEAIGATRTARWLATAIASRKDADALAKLDARFTERPEDLAALVMRHLAAGMGERLLRFPSAARRVPAIDAWFRARGGLGALGRPWFERMRECGDDVRELLHDGHPTACVGDAAFGYVNVFSAHVNVGFFLGAELADPAGLLEGTGKRMRHVKLRPGEAIDDKSLAALVRAAYLQVRSRARA